VWGFEGKKHINVASGLIGALLTLLMDDDATENNLFYSQTVFAEIIQLRLPALPRLF